MQRSDWEDIVLRAKDMFEDQDSDYFGTHWLLEEYKEDGVLSDEQWFYFEHNINESAFAEFAALHERHVQRRESQSCNRKEAMPETTMEETDEAFEPPLYDCDRCGRSVHQVQCADYGSRDLCPSCYSTVVHYCDECAERFDRATYPLQMVTDPTGWQTSQDLRARHDE